jgi:hypothetical protein
LENDQNGKDEERRKGAGQVLQDLQLQEGAGEDEGEKDHQKTGHHRSSARAADETQGVKNPHREDKNLHHGPPNVL